MAPRLRLAFCAALAWHASAGTFTHEVHGSGTTNPKNMFWNIMQILQDRVKESARLTYRAVGSSTGQKEFSQTSDGVFNSATNLGVNDFGAGDIPMEQDRFDGLTGAGRGMVHVPFALSGIGVFHSVPPAEVGNDGLKLSACNLAKIFSGQITTWDHADIKADNANLAVPAGQAIKVGHRTAGSSSTGGLTSYLNAACAGSWLKEGNAGTPMGAGAKLTTWPTLGNFASVEGSQGMTAHIEGQKYAIGYIDAGHGHLRNFAEAKIKNVANTWLTSLEALAASDGNNLNGIAAAAQAVQNLPAAHESWAAVDFNSQAGTNTWPIVLVSYIYLNKDMSSMAADKAALLKAFVDFVMDAGNNGATAGKGQAMLPSYSFVPVPSAMKSKWEDANTDGNAAQITWPQGITFFTFEETTDIWNGQGSSVISVKRANYDSWKLDELALQLETTKKTLTDMESHLDDYGIVPLHGSGTTNPKNWFALAMKNLEHRARVPLMLTYRAVGSSTGQKEFVGQASNGYKSYNHFGAGDIPMSADRFQTLSTQTTDHMVHLPFALGAIGVFHSVPMDQVGAAELKLDACLLAKIFSGQITTWDHADIVAQNPGINAGSQRITVGHRTLGSSSTGGFTGYLHKKCAASWSLGASSTVSWPTTAGFVAVQGSQGMQNHVSNVAYAIGYMDAGHGYDYDLSEVALTNAAGRTFTSKDAAVDDGIAAAGAAAVTDGVFPTDFAADWSAVNLYDMSGANTWPIVLVSYMYVKKDQTKTNKKTAAALKAFVEYILKDSDAAFGGDNLGEKFGFTKLPPNLKTNVLAAADTIVYPAGMETFTFESSTSAIAGMKENVISKKRVAFDDYERSTISADVVSMKAEATTLKSAAVEAADFTVVPLHGSGTTNPKNWFAKAMKVMEHRARVPLLLTYRAVGSGTGQKEFVGQAANMWKSYNGFGAGDIPMSASNYQLLTAAGEHMVHLPFALNAIGIFHSVPGVSGELKLDACLLAKIFGGTVTTWDHADIRAQNPGLAVPAGKAIQVGHRTLGSSSTGGFTAYLHKKCGASGGTWTLGAGSTVQWPTKANFNAVQGSQNMQNHIKDTEYAIGYMDVGHGWDYEFSEVALTNLAGTTQTSRDSMLKGGIADAGAEGVLNSAFPADASTDWSAVNLYDMAGKETWPIVLVSYLYVKKDQGSSSPGTAAALKAFVDVILNDQDNFCTEFGFTPLPTAMKTLSLTAAASIEYPAGMQSFGFETSTHVIGGMKQNVLSAKRIAWDDYERGTLSAEVAKLKAELAASEAARKATAQVIQQLENRRNPPPEDDSKAKGNQTGESEEAAADADMGIAIGAYVISGVSMVCSAFAVFQAQRKAKGATSYQNQGNVIGNPL